MKMRSEPERSLQFWIPSPLVISPVFAGHQFASGASFKVREGPKRSIPLLCLGSAVCFTCGQGNRCCPEQ